jgi:hypothetical protein
MTAPIRHKYIPRTTFNIRGIPRHVKSFFKAHCAKRGISMQRAIVELMVKEIQKSGYCIRIDKRDPEDTE